MSAKYLPLYGLKDERARQHLLPRRSRKREDPPKRVPFALISDCALAALLQTIFSRHRVFEEILVLRCEAFRKLENLKAVAITDGPELDIG